jgi:hypothetical protein
VYLPLGAQLIKGHPMRMSQPNQGSITELEIEKAKWPAPAAQGDRIELATAIAGKVWRVFLYTAPWDAEEAQHCPQCQIDPVNAVIHVRSGSLGKRLLKLMRFAHMATCFERVSKDPADVVQQTLQLMIEAERL